MKKVSIIVPVYNVEKYLKRCLDSLINQSIDNYEIILVNDGSLDRSQDIIDEYVKKYSKKIKAFRKENGGQASARNFGIANAEGEYLGFVDSDDYIDLNMFEKMYDMAVENNADIVTCNYKIFNESTQETENYDLKVDNQNIVRDFIIKQPAIWNKLVKRKIFVENNLKFPEGIIYEDYALTPLIAPLGKIVHTNEHLYYYVVRDNSTMTQKKFNKKFHDIITATIFLYKHFKNNQIYDKYYQEYEYLIICNLLRDNYIRLRSLKEAEYILNEAMDWIHDNIPKWYQNNYYKQNYSFKQRIYNFLIYKKKYKMLGVGKEND